ncbi:MAG TPA: histidinol-phosphatase [Caulobacteraceae bacterium]|nr:histidinol-phosphatase [Caulobacteraceae bacterium]
MAEQLSQTRTEALDALLLELNAASAAAILPFFRAEHGLEDKGRDGRFDPVTLADKGGEAAIRKLVGERFPEHGFIGEEYGPEREDAEFVWVIDPIDGTRAFIAGLPLWTTLIGLRFQGEPVLGSIGQPYLGEVFVGSALGARLKKGDAEIPIRVRPCPDLASAIIATTDPELFRAGEQEGWRALRKAVRLARFGCDAYAYAMVAMGALDLVVEGGLKPWDIEAAIPLLAAAGGFVTDWRGRPLGREAGATAIAGDRACLDAAVGLLSAGAR